MTHQRNVVVHMTECKPLSTIASARVARFIVETLEKDLFFLVDSQQSAKAMVCDADVLWQEMPYPIRHLIIVNGPMAFCDFLPELARLVTLAEKVIWVQQDYTIMPPAPHSTAESPFRKAFADRKLRPDFWTTVLKNVQTPNDHYINWNQLTYDPLAAPKTLNFPIHPTLFYYGAYREKREQDFKFYFANVPYRVHISTTAQRGKKFKALDEDIQILQPFTIYDVPLCSATLYIEDYKSHTEFHSPANRFYEMLSAGIPILFDVRTTKMLYEAGIVPKEEWIVRGPEDVYKKLTTLPLAEVSKEQRNKWCLNYRSSLVSQLRNIWTYYDESAK